MIKKNPSSKASILGHAETSRLVQFKTHYFALYIPHSYGYNSSFYRRILSSCIISPIYWQLRVFFFRELHNQLILTCSFHDSIRLNICTVLILTRGAGCSDYCMTSDLACWLFLFLNWLLSRKKIIWFVFICSVSP